MRSPLIGFSAALLTAFALAPAANAQFSDNFDSYAAGSQLESQGGWEHWQRCGGAFNNAFVTASTAQSTSGANSASMMGAPAGICPDCSDTIHELGGPYSTGQWTITMQTYIDSASFSTGDAYVIFLDGYDDCDATLLSWASQTHFQASTGMIVTDNLGGMIPTGGDQAIMFDAWAEYRLEIDLDTDTFKNFYNGVEMFEGPWAGDLAAIDLYSPDDTSEWLVDDLSVEPGIVGNLGVTYCMAANNSTGTFATMSAFGSSVASVNNVTITASNVPNNQFGIFVVSDTTGFVPGVGGTSNGNLCLGGGIGRYSNPGEIVSSGSAGEFSFTIDTSAIRRPANSVPALPGQTWFFQAWFRDGVGLGSNFTEGLGITFQ